MPIIIKKVYTNQEVKDMATLYSDLSSNAAIMDTLRNKFVGKCGYGMLILDILSINRNPLISNRDRPNGYFRYGVELELRGITYEEGEIITDCKIENIVESTTLKSIQLIGRNEHSLMLLKYIPEIQHYKVGDIVPIVVKSCEFDIAKGKGSIGAEALTFESLLDIDAEEEEKDRVYYFDNFGHNSSSSSSDEDVSEWDSIQKMEKLYNDLISKLKMSSDAKSNGKTEFVELINPYKKTSKTKLEKKGFPGYKKISLVELRETYQGKSGLGMTGEIIHPYFLDRHEPFVYFKDKLSDSSITPHKPEEALQGIWNSKIKTVNLLLDLSEKFDPTDKEFQSSWSPFVKSKR